MKNKFQQNPTENAEWFKFFNNEHLKKSENSKNLDNRLYSVKRRRSQKLKWNIFFLKKELIFTSITLLQEGKYNLYFNCSILILTEFYRERNTALTVRDMAQIALILKNHILYHF